MPVLHLTERAVERLPAPDPSGKQVVYWDQELKGFGVLVSGVSKAKTFVVQHKIAGKNRRVTVAPVAVFQDNGGLAAARIRAKQVLSEFYAGRDPKAVSRKGEADLALAKLLDVTLSEALEDYVAAVRDLRPATINCYRQAVSRYLKDWATKPLRLITPDMVQERHEFIQKTIAKRRGKSIPGMFNGEATANQSIRTLRLVWHFHAERVETEARRILGDDYRPVFPPSPVTGMRRRWFAAKKRTRIIQPEQMPAFYAALGALPNHVQRAYIQVLLFSGLRRGECAKLEWSHVDFAKRTLFIPAANAKSKRDLTLPLTTFLYDILHALRERGRESEFVFPGSSKSGHLIEPRVPLREIAIQSGVLISAHDLRRGYLTAAERCKISHYSMKALVNHSLPSGDVTGGYVQVDIEALREPAQQVAEYLARLCKAKAPTKPEAPPKRERLPAATRDAA